MRPWPPRRRVPAGSARRPVRQARAGRPGHVALEGRFPRATVEDLRRRGPQVEVGDDWSLGRVTAAARDGELLKAAANPRLMQNYAIGR